jgi:hypothetical protein
LVNDEYCYETSKVGMEDVWISQHIIVVASVKRSKPIFGILDTTPAERTVGEFQSF